MKELNINPSHLQNDEHFQFYISFGEIVTEYDPAELKVETQFQNFVTQFRLEDEALKKISKSARTEEIRIADARRSEMFRGLAETCDTATRHFDETIKKAAKEVKVVFDTYGNLARKGMSKKNSAIANFLTELHDNYREEVKTAGLEAWVERLQESNEECHLLMKERWEEIAARTKVVMRDARKLVDAAYSAIIERILALRLIEGGEIYDSFLSRLKAVINTYNNAIAQRRGRNVKENGDGAEPAV